MDFKNIKTDKKILLIIALSIILTAVLGFYGGRYYERTIFRSNMQQRTQNFRQNGGQGNTNTRRNMGTGNQDRQMPPLPN